MNLYIDESGSMTQNGGKNNRYFVISVLAVKDPIRVKHNYKHFVSRNYKRLQEIDKQQKMFTNGEFRELKGSELTPELKKQFMRAIFSDNSLEEYYIVIDNTKVEPHFYENKARAFNYIVTLAIKYWINHDIMTSSIENIEIDERNESTKTIFFLEEYINTELYLEEQLLNNNIEVHYFDSRNNKLIQVSDVLANIKYSNLLTINYNNEFNNGVATGYIHKDFVFPPKNRKKVVKSG